MRIKPVAEFRVLRLPVLLPERLGLISRRHGKRIRRAYADSSDPPAHERAPSEVGHPQRERCGGERDDPRTPAGERRVDGDEPQTERRARRTGLRGGCAARAEWCHSAPRYHSAATQGRSSAGRALVSKTRGRRFDPCRPCWVNQAQARITTGAAPVGHSRELPLKTAGNHTRLADYRPIPAAALGPLLSTATGLQPW